MFVLFDAQVAPVLSHRFGQGGSFHVSFAALQHRRCQNEFTAQARRNMENAQTKIDRAHEDQVHAHKALFKKKSARAVAGLRQTALGCAWLIAVWTALHQRVISQDGMSDTDQCEMIRLTSVADGDGSADAMTFYTLLQGYVWGPWPDPRCLDFLKVDVPDSLWEPLM
jgi:hypothetical protein